MSKVTLALGAALSIFFTSSVLACQSKTFIIDEPFKTPDAGWDAPDKFLSYGPSGASIVSDPGKGYFSLNKNYTSDGVDLCSTFAWPASLDKIEDKKPVNAGVLFWAKDNNNYYVAVMNAAGSVYVSRMIAGKWSRINTKDFNDPKVVRLSASDKNEVEVQITGSHAAIRLNGQPVFEVNGQPPSGGGYVGITAGMGDPALPIVFSAFQLAALP